MPIPPRHPRLEDQSKYAYMIPQEWRHIVCTCANPDYNEWDDTGRFRMCSKCHCVSRRYTSHCSGCKQFYLMVFDHRNWTPALNWCWTCITQVMLALEEDRPAPEWVKPQPKKTAEEVAAEVDDMLSDMLQWKSSVDFDF